MSAPDDAELPVLELVKTLTRADAAVKDVEDACLGGTGLSRSQFVCLMALGNTDGLRMGDIARELLVTKGSITQLVREMERKNLVTKARNPNNEREVIVRLTVEGEKMFAMLYPKRQEVLKEAFNAALSREEQHVLSGMLTRLREECGRWARSRSH